MNDYQAIYDAANDLYAAMQAVERRLSAQVPDASTQYEALRLTTTRLQIQKLLGAYSSVPPLPSTLLPSTPGEVLAAKPVIRIDPPVEMPTDTSNESRVRAKPAAKSPAKGRS